MEDEYVRFARVIRVVDGDTIVADVHLGYLTTAEEVTFRLLGVNCPERKGETKPAGDAAKVATEEWIAKCGGRLAVKSFVDKNGKIDRDSFRRVLARIVNRETGEDLGEFLLKSGHAVPFMTAFGSEDNVSGREEL